MKKQMKWHAVLWTTSLLLLNFLYIIVFDPDKRKKKNEKRD